MTMIRAAFHTLGCKTNHYETDAIRSQFIQAGFTDVPFNSFADVYLVNTCTVTGEAGRKSRQMLRRARKVNAGAVVVALGCHSELESGLEGVDIVIGTTGKSRALELVCAELQRQGFKLPRAGSCSSDAPGPAIEDGYEELGLVDHQSETRAYVKIEDGCDNFCAYCAIPYARGRVRSRPEENILAETRALASAGYKEIVLTGIHVCSYGADHGLASHAVMELALKMAEIEGIERIRLGSLEPQSVTPEFIELAVRNTKLLPHFHLSLQSGSDGVLSRMQRHYSSDDYRTVVQRLRTAFDRPGLTTDVIVGFPGETDAEHGASLAFCSEMGFSRLHIFRYSRREGTLAATLPGQVSAAAMAARSQAMQELADRLALEYHSSQIGRSQAVLLEARRLDGLYEGYSPEYVPVRTPALAGMAEGQIVHVTGVEANREFLFCR